MSAIEAFLKGKSKSFLYYLKLIYNSFNTKTKEIDTNWKKIKLKSTFTPISWDINNPYGSVSTNYQKEFKTFKRYK